MFIKIHESYRNVVALCDNDLIGKKFEEGNRQLEIRESFFKGEEVDRTRAIEVLKRQVLEDAAFNIVGKESVSVAEEIGMIEEGSAAEIQGVPFALVLV